MIGARRLAEQRIQHGQCGLEIFRHEKAADAEPLGGVEVALGVVEEEGALRGDAAESFEGALEDAGIGFADAFFRGVDDDFEQFVGRNELAPAVAEFLGVVRDEPGPKACRAQISAT